RSDKGTPDEGTAEGSPPRLEGGTVVPNSCANAGDGRTNCGSDGGDSGESCCISLVVDGGAFIRSYDGIDGGAFTDDRFHAAVATFRLDKYEVTVGRFRSFVDFVDSGWTPPRGSGRHTHL